MKNPPDINFPYVGFVSAHTWHKPDTPQKTCEAQTWNAQRSSARMED